MELKLLPRHTHIDGLLAWPTRGCLFEAFFFLDFHRHGYQFVGPGTSENVLRQFLSMHSVFDS
ncbi:hypothetical protein Q664_28335 [Archangium violaceum Cb vi76]|uniref:Uncharacterized protein n=1 Tax=Archangium violaceum Cb vi76 TaxID=1406225 RepID=A0A084SPS0_9BACT|nr:hypothetical protein Q664_28335 [Archangium violaceum Cb vi76]